MKSIYMRLTRRLVDVPALVHVGHYAMWPLAGFAVAMRLALELSPSYALAYAVGAPGLLLLPAMIAHGSGICTRGKCAVLMSATPSEDARRYRWHLHHTHHQLRSAITWGMIAAWAVTTFVIVSPILSAVPVVALLVIEVHAIQIHSRLRPWCPECNGKGKGDDEPPAPLPEPDDGRRRQPRMITEVPTSVRGKVNA